MVSNCLKKYLKIIQLKIGNGSSTHAFWFASLLTGFTLWILGNVTENYCKILIKELGAMKSKLTTENTTFHPVPPLVNQDKSEVEGSSEEKVITIYKSNSTLIDKSKLNIIN